jgi:GT2 family glycosyltransferase
METSVSIVTRTIGRPEFLERCFVGLLHAAPHDAEWIIVDDAPEARCLDPVILARFSARARFPVRYIRASGEGGAGVGRTKAANIGLEQARGRYFHLHDDDDACLPKFYKRTMAWMDSHPDHVAVSTLATRVIETQASNGGWRTLNTTVHNPHLRKISFASLATAFDIPPICLLVRTVAAIRIKGFNPHFDIGEDYDFALRLLVEGDIGVVREQLCSIHQRAGKIDDVGLMNSHTADELHAYDARIRNHYFRQDILSGRIGLGWLLIVGEMNASSRQFSLLFDALSKLPFAQRLRKLLRG